MNTKRFEHKELYEALLFTQDILERSHIPFILLKHTAKSVVDGESDLGGGSVELGILKKDIMRYNSSTLKSLLPEGMEWKDRSIRFKHRGVPVNIAVIKSQYEFFKYPDKKWYGIEDFNIPNPFNEYWKIKQLIR